MAAKKKSPASPESAEPLTPGEMEESRHGEEIDAAIAKLEAHKTKIVAGVLAVILVLCAILIGREMAESKRIDAAMAYTSASSPEGYLAVVSEFPSSVSAGDALLSKADAELKAGSPEDAKATLQTFINSHKDHPRHAQGIFALGMIHHRAGEYDQASASYDQALNAAGKASDLVPLIKIRQGDLALEQGDPEKARQIYEVIIPSHPGTLFFDRVEEKLVLAELGQLKTVPAPEPKPEEPATPPAPAVETTPAPPKEPVTPAPMPATDKPAPASPDSPPAPKPGKPNEEKKADQLAPAKKPAEKPASKKTPAPADKPKEKPAEPEAGKQPAPASMPADKPSTKPADQKPAPAPADKPKETPAGNKPAPANEPAGKPMDSKPAEKNAPPASKPNKEEAKGEAPEKPQASEPKEAAAEPKPEGDGGGGAQ